MSSSMVKGSENPQLNSQRPGNFWDIFSPSTNPGKADRQASAIVNVYVQPLNEKARNKISEKNQQECEQPASRPKQIKGHFPARSGSDIGSQSLIKLSCPSCGFDLASSLEQWPELKSYLCGNRTSTEGKGSKRPSMATLKNSSNQASRTTKQKSKCVPNKPLNSNTSLRSSTLRRSQQLNEIEACSVCDENYGRQTKPALSASRMYMEDIKVVQNMRECWERYLQIKFEGGLPPEPEMIFENNFPVPAPPNNNQCAPANRGRPYNAGGSHPKSVQARSRISQENPKKVVPIQYESKVIKSRQHPVIESDNGNCRDDRESHVSGRHNNERSFAEIRQDFETVFASVHPDLFETNNCVPSHQENKHEPVNAYCSEEKVCDWMNRNDTLNAHCNHPNFAQNCYSSGTSPAYQCEGAKSDKTHKKSNIIQMATEFELFPCCGGSLALEQRLAEQKLHSCQGKRKP